MPLCQVKDLQYFEELCYGRRKKEEGKILHCLSFKLFICPKLSFDCYIYICIYWPGSSLLALSPQTQKK
ncbi:MAG: hypothetical protein F6K39_42310 [Okeania sp. SIO3B3]|nr:hypothetical protein [Okeania sp. SIO3B3]